MDERYDSRSVPDLAIVIPPQVPPEITLQRIRILRTKKLLLAFCVPILCHSLPSIAEMKYAVGSEIGVMQVNVNDEDFNPFLANIYFDARHSSGLGAEVLAATGIADDKASQVELDLASHQAIFATYSVKGNRVTTTLGAGYGKTELDASLRGGSYPGESTFEGGALFLRFHEGFKRWPNWHLSMGLSSLFDNSDVDIWSANIGLRYEF